MIDIQLRNVTEDDLSIFFDFQRDPDANHMAAFTAKDPDDRAAFMAKWKKILADPTITVRSIVVGDDVVGNVMCHSWFGDPEVSYWIDKPFWGRGIATQALTALLKLVSVRPLFAHAVNDNAASLRVLEKCGFVPIGAKRDFANGRGEEVDELILKLE